MADEIVMQSPGTNARNGVAAGGAAGASSLIFAAGDLQKGDGQVNDGADATDDFAFTGAMFAAMGARSFCNCSVPSEARDLLSAKWATWKRWVTEKIDINSIY